MIHCSEWSHVTWCCYTALSVIKMPCWFFIIHFMSNVAEVFFFFFLEKQIPWMFVVIVQCKKSFTVNLHCDS